MNLARAESVSGILRPDEVKDRRQSRELRILNLSFIGGEHVRIKVMRVYTSNHAHHPPSPPSSSLLLQERATRNLRIKYRLSQVIESRNSSCGRGRRNLHASFEDHTTSQAIVLTVGTLLPRKGRLWAHKSRSGD